MSIKVGVSRCLLGEKVRYDGAAKYSSICSVDLAEYFQLISVCPEVDAGLAIPRPAVELVLHSGEVRMLGRDDPSLDVTKQLSSFIARSLLSLDVLSGFVLTTRSPSCGLNSVPIRLDGGDLLADKSSGLFAQALVERYPCMPIIEEQELKDVATLKVFQIRIIVYSLLRRQLTADLTGLLPFSDEVLAMDGLMKKMTHVTASLQQLNKARLSSLLKQLREFTDE